MTGLTALLTFLLLYSLGLAQDQQPIPTEEPVVQDHSEMESIDATSSQSSCDVETFMRQQEAYAVALAAFSQVYQTNPEAALLTVYYAGITYQTFAESCGFVPPEEAAHGHDEEEATVDEHSDEAHMNLAMSIGDPENGQVLFTTLIPETGFACSTCHRVDSTETLIGPGLLNIADPSHNPSQHEHGDSDVEATEAAPIERTMDEVVDYIRTSIVHPSEYVDPGYPDLLMPQNYEQLLNEQQINDLVAYLLTLPS
jgi:cytochrome c2